ncbi:MAG: polymer-forming cytoskeletal protein [Candidatus Omnitrophota bacterium]
MIGDNKKKKKEAFEEKILDVDAAMTGSLIFKDPVKLKINGRFDGNLDMKGTLTIGEGAKVNAKIVSDEVIVSGYLEGEVIAKRKLSLTSTARLVGKIRTPKLVVEDGAILQGESLMSEEQTLGIDDLARYLEVDVSLVQEWANSGKIPAQREGDSWKFERNLVDEWLATQK